MQKNEIVKKTTSSINQFNFEENHNFLKMKKEEVVDILVSSFLNKSDWTYDIDNEDWNKIFENGTTRNEKIKKWLDACVQMQLTAACCIGNAYHSINIAYVFALYIELYKGRELKDKIEYLADLIEENGSFGSFEDVIKDFNSFKLYYGLILKENGNIIIDNKNDDNIIGSDVFEEVLIGRNFKHYVNSKVIKKNSYKATDNSFNLTCDKNKYKYDNTKLLTYLSADCWVKRIVVSEEEIPGLNYYWLILNIENNKIIDIKLLLESISLFDSYVYIPGVQRTGYFTRINNIKSETILLEIEMIMNRRYLNDDFSFFEKKLPRSIIRDGGNGGSNTQYIESINSSIRQAYMSLVIDTTEDGIIKSFDYSTYESSGNGYWDMFTRPQSISNMKEEEFDFLLYLMDQYSNDEYKDILNKK